MGGRNKQVTDLNKSNIQAARQEVPHISTGTQPTGKYTHPANAGQRSAKNSPTNVLIFVVCEVGCSRELLLPVVFPLLGTIVFTAIQLFAADRFCRR